MFVYYRVIGVTIHKLFFMYLYIMCIFFFVAFVEYCASHAVPSVKESQYLKHIGDHLHPDIDIMWTGEFLYIHQFETVSCCVVLVCSSKTL